MDNLTLVPKWVSRLEQDRILQLRCADRHFWEGRRRVLRHANDDEDMESENEEGIREDKHDRRLGENSLYWKAITQLLANETEEVSSVKWR